MRLKSTLSKASGQNTQLMRQYRYSPAGNLTEKETGHGSYTYQYDKLYRLIQVENPTQNDESYTYGFLGNRLSSSSTTGTWNYDANNELLGYDSVSFTYDANGNTIQKDDNGVVTDYSYNVEDRLVEVTTNNPQPTTSNYYYVPLERRLWKEVGGIRTYFVYSDEGLAGEYDSGGQEIRTYGWIPGSDWSTDPLFVRIGGIYYWYRNDHLGAPQKIVTTSGAVVWSAIYDSFGKCHIATETITNNLRFPGQYHDSETGLYYNLNRYYDPTTGRYLRADPFGDGINLYTYCFNNPLLFIDPEGLCAVRTFFTLENQANFWAGFGDTLTLGGTEWIREQWNKVFWDSTDVVNYESGFYRAGKWGAYAWEVVFANIAGVKVLGREVFVQAVKRGGVTGIVSGSLDFIYEVARGRSLTDALKEAIITGTTNAVGYGLPASGIKIRLSIAVAVATNLVLQKNVTGKANVKQALVSVAPPSVGGAFMYAIDMAPIPYVGAVATGLITAPANLAGNIFFSKNSAEKQRRTIRR